MVTREDIAQRAYDFRDYLLDRFPKLKKKKEKAVGRCPTPNHNDKDPSFSYCPDMDAWVCSCGSGKGSTLRGILGYRHPVDDKGGEMNTKGPRIKLKSKKKAAPAPAPAEIPEPDDPSGEGKPDCIHLYSNGNRKVKWRNPKVIMWETLLDGEWVPGMSGDPGLYHQDKIDDSDLVLFSESESDCDALEELGYVAVSVPHGASKDAKKPQINEDHAKLLEGKLVTILQHNDEAGEAFAKSCQEVISKYAKKVWVASFSDYNDIRDAINDGATKGDIDNLVESTRPKPPTGIPVRNLVEIADDQVEYAIEPIAPRGSLSQLQGEPKGGKSCFAFYAALCAAQGIWPAGKFKVTSPQKVVFITWEDGPIRLKRRALQYNPPIKHGELPEGLVVYPHDRAPHMWVNHKKGEELLLEIINYHNADLVILDTLSYIHDADENRSHEMKPVMQAVRNCAVKTNAAIMLVHHTRKTASGGDIGSAQARGRGSSAIAAAADVIVDWGSRAGDNITNCSFISKDDDSFDFSVHYKPLEDGTIDWEVSDKANKTSVQEKKNTILDGIKCLYGTEGNEDGTLRSNLVSAVNMSKNTVIKHAKSLIAEGLIVENKVGSKNSIAYIPTEIQAPITDEPNLL